MATAGDHSMNCTVCLDAFKNPRLLPCCHTFCKGCLEHVLEKSETKRKLTCPQCRQEHSIPANGIDGLLTDFTIASDVAASSALKASEQKPPCGECDGSDPAVAYCCECESYLCEYCSGTHKRLKRFRDHSVVPLDALTPDTLKPSRRPLFCPIHLDKQPVAYCKNCQILVCSECIVLTSHARHLYGAIDAATRKEAETRLKTELDRSKTKLITLKEDLEYIKGVDQQVGKYPDKLKTAINGTFDALITNLETRRAQLLLEAETSCTADLKKVWPQKEVVERAVMGLENTVTFTERVLQCSSDAEFLSLCPQASSQLKHLQLTKWDIQTVGRLEATKPEFSGGNHTAYLQNIGQLQNVHIPAHIVVKGLSSNLLLGETTEFAVTSERRMGIAKPTVRMVCGYAKKEYPVHSVNKSQGNWVVTFTPICGGQNLLTVSVEGGIVEGNPFQFTVKGRPQRGVDVTRGPDWRDGDIDGGIGSRGTVGKISTQEGYSLWVKWDSGRSSRIRWGTDSGKYDIVLTTDD